MPETTPPPEPARDARRMRVLWVISSSNQMYSGIGRAVFELSRRLMPHVDYEFAIDDAIPRNLDLVRAFGDAHGMPVHVSRGLRTPHCLDTVGEGLAEVVAEPRWDLIECLCWANASTNDALLDAVGDRALAFTPHYQPSWTVPMDADTTAHTEDALARVIRRSDVVFCDSPWEREELRRFAPSQDNRAHLSLGCDFRNYVVGPRRRERKLLFVGDLAEPRKRLDRVIGVMERVVRLFPDLKLVVVGNGIDGAIERIPVHLRPHCELRGYVSESELRQAYAECSGLFLLSDFEAFGIPILEALAVGTPVFLTDLDVTRSIFNLYRGARFCPGDDVETTARIVATSLERGVEAIDEALADRVRLEATFDWDVLAEQKWQALRSAWFGRHYVGRPFHGPHASIRSFPRPVHA